MRGRESHAAKLPDVRCAACNEELPGTFPYCPFCGAAVAGPAPRGREERKIVTVLFADLVGFTARAERLDPEDVRALLEPYHAHLRSELERFGGTVEKFIGDAVMALFGAPVAHEDDPERAVRAALAIRDWAVEQGERAPGARRGQHRRGARRRSTRARRRARRWRRATWSTRRRGCSRRPR